MRNVTRVLQKIIINAPRTFLLVGRVLVRSLTKRSQMPKPVTVELKLGLFSSVNTQQHAELFQELSLGFSQERVLMKEVLAELALAIDTSSKEIITEFLQEFAIALADKSLPSAEVVAELSLGILELYSEHSQAFGELVMELHEERETITESILELALALSVVTEVNPQVLTELLLVQNVEAYTGLNTEEFPYSLPFILPGVVSSELAISFDGVLAKDTDVMTEFPMGGSGGLSLVVPIISELPLVINDNLLLTMNTSAFSYTLPFMLAGQTEGEFSVGTGNSFSTLPQVFQEFSLSLDDAYGEETQLRQELSLTLSDERFAVSQYQEELSLGISKGVSTSVSVFSEIALSLNTQKMIAQELLIELELSYSRTLEENVQVFTELLLTNSFGRSLLAQYIEEFKLGKTSKALPSEQAFAELSIGDNTQFATTPQVVTELVLALVKTPEVVTEYLEEFLLESSTEGTIVTERMEELVLGLSKDVETDVEVLQEFDLRLNDAPNILSEHLLEFSLEDSRRFQHTLGHTGELALNLDKSQELTTAIEAQLDLSGAGSLETISGQLLEFEILLSSHTKLEN